MPEINKQEIKNNNEHNIIKTPIHEQYRHKSDFNDIDNTIPLLKEIKKQSDIPQSDNMAFVNISVEADIIGKGNNNTQDETVIIKYKDQLKSNIPSSKICISVAKSFSCAHYSEIDNEPVIEFPEDDIEAEGINHHTHDFVVLNEDDDDYQDINDSKSRVNAKKSGRNIRVNKNSLSTRKDKVKNIANEIKKKMMNNYCCISLLFILITLIIYIYSELTEEDETKEKSSV